MLADICLQKAYFSATWVNNLFCAFIYKTKNKEKKKKKKKKKTF